MHARFLIVTLAAAVPGTSHGQASGAALDEAAVVQRALARPAVEASLRASSDAALADELGARRWPNPEVSWAHEEVSGADTAREDVALLTQRFDLAGRRGLRGDAMRRRVASAEAESAFARLGLEADARRTFAELLAQERRVAIVRSAAERLRQVGAAVARRAAGGDVAGYDLRRVDRERLLVLDRLDLEEGRLSRLRARLVALAGLDPAAGPPALAGDLATPPPPALEALLERVATRPDLEALALEAAASDLERRAAGRWLVPELELGGGIKSVELAGRRESGWTATLAFPIPLFSRDQDERLRSEASASGARARLELALAEARGEVRGLHAEAQRLASAAARRANDPDPEGIALLGVAEAAYRGGEVGVLELVDAYRSSLDSSLALLELQLAARRARVELDLTSGGSVR